MTESHLPKFADLPQHQLEFLGARRERVTAMLPAYEDLRKQLLALGGVEVVLPRYDQFSEVEQRRQAYDVEQVLARGETWLGSRAVLELRTENNCHNNVAQIRSSGRGSITSGWALADDGLWREHSWLLLRSADSEDSVLETTQAWLLYHGYRLDARETGWFIHSELGPDAPVPGAA
jgi:hypothetical protein